MMDTKGWTVAGLAGLAVAGTAAASDARVRVVHASPDAPAVDVWVEGSPAFQGVSFTEVTEYASLPGGSYDVQVVPADDTEPVVIDAALGLDPATSYTVLAVNTLEQIQPLVLTDDNSTSDDFARVRFVHASPNAPAVDIALADGGPVLFGDIEFTETGHYIEVGPGTYDLEARLAGTDTVVLENPGVVLDTNTVYTAYAMGLVGEKPALQAVLSVDARDTSRVRVVHASPDAPTVDVWVSGASAFTRIAFTDVTDYAALPFGSYDVAVAPSGNFDTIVIDATLDLDPLTDYSVLAIDELSRIAPLVLIDDNSLIADAARVRFVHASPNAPAVDIALADGGPVLFGDIEYTEIGDYIEVPQGTYDLEARLAGTDTAVLDIPGVMLSSNSVYTAYAMGFAGGEPALQAVLSVDAVACTSDFNGDGAVDFHDLLLLLDAWGSSDATTDLDGTGIVGFADLLLLLDSWGPCS